MVDRQQEMERDFEVILLCGGTSNEREVSMASARAVEKAVRELGLRVHLRALAEDVLPDDLNPSRHLVMPLIHGRYGEDGQLSAELEARGLAYVGSGRAASALCFDKLACKAIAGRSALVVAPELCFPASHMPSYACLVEALGMPFILKPRFDGSSVGLYLVDSEDMWEEAALALRERPVGDYLAEAFVPGIDVTVGLVEDTAVGTVAVYPEGGLYDYAHKYTAGKTRYEAPADLPEALTQRLKEASTMLFSRCQCRDYGRVDFRVDANGKPWFLEINTLPGMTPTSLLPKAAACAGISFNGLIERLLRRALERNRRSC